MRVRVRLEQKYLYLTPTLHTMIDHTRESGGTNRLELEEEALGLRSYFPGGQSTKRKKLLQGQTALDDGSETRLEIFTPQSSGLVLRKIRKLMHGVSPCCKLKELGRQISPRVSREKFFDYGPRCSGFHLHWTLCLRGSSEKEGKKTLKLGEQSNCA